jgi:hypothetical protein
MHIKLHEKSESGPKNLKKGYFQAKIGLFVVLTTMTNHTKTPKWFIFIKNSPF